MKGKILIIVFTILFLLSFTVWNYKAFGDDYYLRWSHVVPYNYYTGSYSNIKCAVDTSGNVYTSGLGHTLIKYNPSGDTVWTRDDGFSPSNIEVDGNGNIFVTGDNFITKYNPSSEIVWSDMISNLTTSKLKVDESGNSIVTGFIDVQGIEHYYAVKYDPSGNIVWADTNAVRDTGQTHVVRVARAQDGSFIAVGYQDTVVYDYDNYSWWVAKYDPSGNFVWADTILVTNQYGYCRNMTADIVTDPNNTTIYVIGIYYQGPYNQYQHIHIIRYDPPNPDPIWDVGNDWIPYYATNYFTATNIRELRIKMDTGGCIYIGIHGYQGFDGQPIRTEKFDSLGNSLWVGEFYDLPLWQSYPHGYGTDVAVDWGCKYIATTGYEGNGGYVVLKYSSTVPDIQVTPDILAFRMSSSFGNPIVDTLSYDDGSFEGELEITGDGTPGYNQTYGFATRFDHTPADLLSVTLYFTQFYGTDFRLYIWDANYNIPNSGGTPLFVDANIPAPEAGEWSYTYLGNQGVSLPETFWVGVVYNRLTSPTADWYLGYDSNTTDDHTFINTYGNPSGWQRLSYLGYPYAFGVRAVVGTNVTIHDTIGIMTVKNVGTYELEVDSITTSQSWIISIDPTSFTLAPDSSQDVTVIVTAQGLPDGVYYDTLNIWSNDLDENPYSVSVRFLIETQIQSTEELEEDSPMIFALLPIRPNPINSYSLIEYTLPKKGLANLSIYDIRGRLVKVLVNGIVEPGYKTAVWKGTDNRGVSVASGIYFCRLRSSGICKTRKIVVIR